MKKLILASASPRRKQMLTRLGISFTAQTSAFKEPAPKKNMSPAAYVKANARGKALNVSIQRSNALIIGADTVVVYRDKVLGKPATYGEAFTFMQMLKGKTHAVYTGMALVDTEDDSIITDYEKTLVTFRDLTDAEIHFYLSRINPLDKAGAYAIQGEGAIIVEGIRGCYYNVVGCPVAKLEQMLLRKGTSLFAYMEA